MFIFHLIFVATL